MKIFKTLSLLAAGFMLTGIGAFAQDAFATPPAPTNHIYQRRQLQQDRIAQGIRSGSLTPREARRAEFREQRVNHQIRADRRANGGRLTARERRQITHRQNAASRAIYRHKHNRRHVS